MLVGMRQSLASSPVVQALFAAALNDFTTLSSTSTMPTGGSISRAGNAMLYAVDGGVAKLTYAPNNLALYNADFSNGVWSSYYASKVGPYAGTDPAGTNTAYEIGLDGGGGGGSATLVYQTFTAVTGVRYMASFYVRAKTGTTSVRVRFFDGSVNDYSSNITVDSTGWTRVYYAYTSTASSASAFFGINTNSTANTTNVYVAFAQLEAVTYQTSPSGTYYLNYPTPNTTSAYYGPRFDYDPVTLQPKGLLVEGTRTNLAVAMSAFTTGNASFASTSAVNGPDGTTSAYVLNDQSATGVFHQLVSEPSGLTANAAYTASAFVKLNTSTSARYITLSNIGGTSLTGAYAVFDIQSGTVANTGTGGSGGTVTGSGITPVGNGWYRVWISGVSSDTTRYFLICGASAGVYSPDGLGRQTYDGASRQWYIYGPQYEIGVFPSSHIPASLTRAAETFLLTGYANRLVEAFYIDEETGGSYSGNSALSTGTVTISPPTFGWVTSLRAYTNAYAGSISTPSWLSFSRAGNAMYYDSTGALTWAPANLLNYSQKLDDTYWQTSDATVVQNTSATSPTGSSPVYTFSSNTANSYHVVYPNGLSFTVGQKIIYSIYVKSNTGQFVQLFGGSGAFAGTEYANFDIINGTLTGGTTSKANIASAGNGWWRISFVFDPSTTTSDAIYLGAITSGTAGRAQSHTTALTYLVWGAQLECVTYQTAPSAYIPTTSAAVYGPRYDYDPSTVPATPRGLLIEESRANLALNSEDLSVWTKASGTETVSADTAVAPSGLTKADTVQRSGTTWWNGVRQTVTLSASTIYTFSCFVKIGNGDPGILVASGTVLDFGIKLNNGTPAIIANTGSSSVISYGATNIGNGWYRLYATFNTSTATTVGYGTADGSSVNNASNYFWGAQLEAGSFATSYIPTTSASVTRAADVAQWTSAAQSSYFNAAAGTFGAQIIRNSSGGNNGAFEVPTSAGVNDLIFANTLVNYRYGTGATPDTIINTAFTSARVMAGYTASNFTRSVVANNGTVVTGTSSGASTYTGAGLYIGRAALGTSILNGHLQSFAYYNQRLPDAILKQKSSVGAPY